MSSLDSHTRRLPVPPSGFENHLSRRDAARILGFSSEFKVRQLEKAGRLNPVRGAMGQAWYPRSEVLALRPTPDPPLRRKSASPGLPSGRLAPPPTYGRWSDAALIAHLREQGAFDPDGPPHPRTVVDLVADTGVSIARAERVYRFWIAHDQHPIAQVLRIARTGGATVRTGGTIQSTRVQTTRAGAMASAPAERRGGDRMERDTLIGQLRHADPAVRTRAFEKLKTGRGPA